MPSSGMPYEYRSGLCLRHGRHFMSGIDCQACAAQHYRGEVQHLTHERDEARAALAHIAARTKYSATNEAEAQCWLEDCWRVADAARSGERHWLYRDGYLASTPPEPDPETPDTITVPILPGDERADETVERLIRKREQERAAKEQSK